MKHSFIMLDYAALTAVAAVFREGSFERAAVALGITPSAVSQRVRGLEERLGTVLVVRAQPCRPTDLGQRLATHIDRVQLLEADLVPLLGLKAIVAGLPPTLKVAVNADSLATWFAGAAAEFALCTDILLDLRLYDETRTADFLRSGEVQAAVTADAEPVQGCRTIQLGTQTYAACASPDFVDRYFAEGVNGVTLERAPYMRHDSRDELQARWAKQAHDAHLRAPAHWVPSTQGFLDLAIAGMAWGLHPLPLVLSHIDEGQLVELPPATRIEVQLYWITSRLQAASLSTLTDAVRRAATNNLKV